MVIGVGIREYLRMIRENALPRLRGVGNYRGSAKSLATFS